MSKYVPKKFPGARYGHGGAVGIFQSEEEVPDGWTDNPNDFAEPKDDKKAPQNERPLAKHNEMPAFIEQVTKDSQREANYEASEMIELRVAYETKFKKAPDMRWGAKTLREKLG